MAIGTPTKFTATGTPTIQWRGQYQSNRTRTSWANAILIRFGYFASVRHYTSSMVQVLGLHHCDRSCLWIEFMFTEQNMFCSVTIESSTWFSTNRVQDIWWLGWVFETQERYRLGHLPRSPGTGEGGDLWSWPMSVKAKGIPRVCQGE